MPHRFDDLLQDLLPVRLQQGAAGPLPARHPVVPLELTPEGAINEATRFYDEPGRNQNAWANLPRYYWCAAADRPVARGDGPGLEPDRDGLRQAAADRPPLRRARAGCMFVGTDETFRWRQNVGERFFYRFWGQATRFVARRDARGGKKSWIEVRPVRATPGEPAEIELMAFGADGKPLGDPKQTVQITGGGKVQTLDVTADPLVKGRYTGPVHARQRRAITAHATPPPGEKDPVEARLRAVNAADELRQPNVNRPLLEQIAATSGGAAGRADGPAEHRGASQGRAEVHRPAPRGQPVGQLDDARAARRPLHARRGPSPPDGVVMNTTRISMTPPTPSWASCSPPGARARLPARQRRQRQDAGRPAPTAAATLNEVEVVRRVNAATDRALDYLERTRSRKGPNAGAWVPDNNAINAMAVLAFLSRGHVPGRGKYGDTVEGGVTSPAC